MVRVPHGHATRLRAEVRRLILLVGGTSETGPLAKVLLAEGHAVLVSQATEVELELPSDPRLAVRRGRLDSDGFRELIKDRAITHVVDASHPFAVDLHGELARVCTDLGIPRIRYERPALEEPSGIEAAPDHRSAAAAAAAYARPILLTTGSRNLAPYLEVARIAGLPLFARVLPGDESERACRVAGFPRDRIEFARGPFSVEQTRGLLRRWDIGVLVAKDGGIASGLAERLEAARSEGVGVVLVRRPEQEPGSVGSFAEVLNRLDDHPSSSRDFAHRTIQPRSDQHGP